MPGLPNLPRCPMVVGALSTVPEPAKNYQWCETSHARALGVNAFFCKESLELAV